MSTDLAKAQLVPEKTTAVSWGAIFAGALIAVITELTLLSLGSGIGFSTYDPELGDTLGRGSMIAVGLYVLLAFVVSTGVGAFVAGKLAAYSLRSTAALHGLCAWALFTIFTVGMLSMGVGRLAGAAFGLVGSGLSRMGSIGAAAISQTNPDWNSIRNEMRAVLSETQKPALAPKSLETQVKALPKKTAQSQANSANGESTVKTQLSAIAGAVDQEAIANVLAARLNISQSEAMTLIDQGQDQASTTLQTIKQKLSAAGSSAAEISTNSTAYASWISFATLSLGAIVSMLAGMFGGPSGIGSSNRTALIARQKPISTEPLSV